MGCTGSKGSKAAAQQPAATTATTLLESRAPAAPEKEQLQQQTEAVAEQPEVAAAAATDAAAEAGQADQAATATTTAAAVADVDDGKEELKKVEVKDLTALMGLVSGATQSQIEVFLSSLPAAMVDQKIRPAFAVEVPAVAAEEVPAVSKEAKAIELPGVKAQADVNEEVEQAGFWKWSAFNFWNCASPQPADMEETGTEAIRVAIE